MAIIDFLFSSSMYFSFLEILSARASTRNALDICSICSLANFAPPQFSKPVSNPNAVQASKRSSVEIWIILPILSASLALIAFCSAYSKNSLSISLSSLMAFSTSTMIGQTASIISPRSSAVVFWIQIKFIPPWFCGGGRDTMTTTSFVWSYWQAATSAWCRVAYRLPR